MVYSGKPWFWYYYFQLFFVCKTVSRISFKLFYSGLKGFYQSSLGNKIDFRDMNVSPNTLTEDWNFKNLRLGLVDERALITTTSMSSCHWKTLLPFCLQKKRPENAFLRLIVNYRKIVQKNKLCHWK